MKHPILRIDRGCPVSLNQSQSGPTWAEIPRQGLCRHHYVTTRWGLHRLRLPTRIYNIEERSNGVLFVRMSYRAPTHLPAFFVRMLNYKIFPLGSCCLAAAPFCQIRLKMPRQRVTPYLGGPLELLRRLHAQVVQLKEYQLLRRRGVPIDLKSLNKALPGPHDKRGVVRTGARLK